MAETVKVEPEALNAMGDRFATRATDLKTITTQLNTNVTMIQVASFLGHVGDAANDKFTNEFVPRLEKLQAKLDEIGIDLKQTVTDYIAEEENLWQDRVSSF